MSHNEYLQQFESVRPLLSKWMQSIQRIEEEMRAKIDRLGIPLTFDARLFFGWPNEKRQTIISIMQGAFEKFRNANQSYETSLRIDGSEAMENFKHNILQGMMLGTVIEDIEESMGSPEKEKSSKIEAALYNPLCVVLAFLRQTWTHLQYYSQALDEQQSQPLGMQEVAQAITTCIDARQGTFGTTALKREHQEFPSERRVPASITTHYNAPIALHWSEAELIELMYFFIGNATRALSDAHMKGAGGYLQSDELRLDIALDVMESEGRKFLAVEIYNGGTGTINLDIIRENLRRIEPSIIESYVSKHTTSTILAAAKALRMGSKQVDASRIGGTDILFVRSAGKAGREQGASGGIGLAIADTMVNEHGGEILVSNHNNGVCVTVLLPLDATEKEKTDLLNIAHALKESLRTGTVLLPHYVNASNANSATSIVC